MSLSADDTAILREMLCELRAIRSAVESSELGRQQGPSDARYAQLFETLADTMEGFDLEFTTSEVIERRETDFALDNALLAVHVTDTAGLGAIFRTLRDRTFADLRLVRDGRAWRLVRT